MGQMDPLYTLPHHFCNKKLTLMLYPNVCLRLKRSLPSIFTVKTVYAFLISPVRATYSAPRTPKSIPTVRCLGHSKESVHVRQQNFVTCCFLWQEALSPPPNEQARGTPLVCCLRLFSIYT
jgi:hypothetical protein